MAVWRLGDRELLVELRDLRRQVNLLFARSLEVISEIDARDVAARAGYGSTIELVRDAQNVTKAQARQHLAAAGSLVARSSPSGAPVPARLPRSANALRAGRLSEAQAAAIMDVVAAIPVHARVHVRGVEQRLAGQAGLLDAGQLRVLGRRELAYLDQDGRPPTDPLGPARYLTLRNTNDGGLRGELRLDAQGAATFRAALSPLAAPRPTEDGSRDGRTVDERHADALVEIAMRLLDRGDLPTERGERPHVVVTIAYDALRRVVESAWLDGAGPIDPESARRYACDAAVIPVVLGSTSEPLDVGRKSYVVPIGIRRALRLRDGGCAHPGCSVPAQWCNPHHVVPWLEGGLTAMDNLVLLCPRHHRLIHHSEWTVDIVGGRPVFRPPPWMSNQPQSLAQRQSCQVAVQAE